MRRAQLRRWATVLGLLGGLVAAPAVIARLPAGGSTVSGAELLARVQASARVGYSGYAESTGSLALPVTTGQLSSVADLFGSTTQLRIWWRGNQSFRVDELTPTGEQDTHAVGANLWTWNFESDTVDLDENAAVVGARLPRADDLVPGSLARRLLTQAGAGEVHRIASKRVAGQTAAGLRYVPAAPQSTIGHIDVWALPGSGLPVAVSVFGRGETTALVSSTMLDLDLSTPAAATTAYSPPAGATIHTEQAPDLLALANRVALNYTAPQLAGLPRDDGAPAGSGVLVYGSGVTVLVAFPVFGRTGQQLHDQLAKAVGSVQGADGITTSIGAVNLKLSNRVSIQGFDRGVNWVFVGTVTTPTLARAQTELFATAG